MGAFDDLVPGGKKKGAGGMSPTVQKELGGIRSQAQSGSETLAQYKQAQAALKRFQPGPFRGAFYDVALPTPGGGIMDKIGAALVGGPARAIGAITPQNVSDFQRLQGLSSERVLEGQIAQKGPQTDSDAARLMLTEISPYKTPDVNTQVIDAGSAKATRAVKRAPFYTKWANKYGLNGVDEQGRDVEQAFQSTLQSQPQSQGGWSITKVK